MRGLKRELDNIQHGHNIWLWLLFEPGGLWLIGDVFLLDSMEQLLLRCFAQNHSIRSERAAIPFSLERLLEDA